MPDHRSEPIFESVADDFADNYYRSVRGHVRREVIRARLHPLLGDFDMALDYGGGDAGDSIWASDHGLRVDYWDDAPPMVRRARESIGELGWFNKPVILDSDPLEDNGQHYDLVMLHGVLQYLEQSAAEWLLEKLAAKMVAGGLLSLATKNFAVVDEKGQIDDGVREFQTRRGLKSLAYSAPYLETWLGRVGFSAIVGSDIKGVRCLYYGDERLIEDMSPEELENMLTTEKHYSTREDSIDSGHMLHAIATKTQVPMLD